MGEPLWMATRLAARDGAHDRRPADRAHALHDVPHDLGVACRDRARRSWTTFTCTTPAPALDGDARCQARPRRRRERATGGRDSFAGRAKAQPDDEATEEIDGYGKMACYCETLAKRDQPPCSHRGQDL